MAQIQPATCFSVGHKLRMVFIFLSVCKISKKICIRTHENDIQISVSINSFIQIQAHIFLYVLSQAAFVRHGRIE